eukprot:8904775-Pyramimonas_sp.AAC.1
MAPIRPWGERLLPWGQAEGGRTNPRSPSSGPRMRTCHALERRGRLARGRKRVADLEPKTATI